MNIYFLIMLAYVVVVFAGPALFRSSHARATDANHPEPGARQRPLKDAPAWMRRTSQANLPEVGTRRAQRVITYCGQCHASPPPALHEDDEWRWMIVRMDMRAMAMEQAGVRIATNEELKDIARYYETYAGERFRNAVDRQTLDRPASPPE